MDRKGVLALLPLDDPESDTLLSTIPTEERSDCWWVVLPDGALVRGDRGGGVTLLTLFPGTRPLGRGLEGLRLGPVVDALDRLLAEWRGRLSRYVPDGPAPRRFP